MQWECKRASDFEAYRPRINQIIEVAHHNNNTYAEWTDYKTRKSMRVYFDKMIETLAHNRSFSNEVRRQLMEKGEIHNVSLCSCVWFATETISVLNYFLTYNITTSKPSIYIIFKVSPHKKTINVRLKLLRSENKKETG